MQNKIINLIDKYTNYKCDQILKCDHIYSGYTNESYYIELIDNKKLFVKYSINKKINKVNEGDIYKIYSPHFLLFSSDNGLLITQWINQTNDFKEASLDNLLIHEIDFFHRITHDLALDDFNYFQYEPELGKYETKNSLYNGLINKWCIGEKVISHNDINEKNFLITKKDDDFLIHLIDFEWTTFNYAWWDYINYLAEQEIYDNSKLKIWSKHIPKVSSIKDLYEMLYIRWWYCLGWTINQENILPKMKEYQNRCWFNINKLTELINN